MNGGVRARCVLAFDYGTRKIGAAVGQTATLTATPLTTLPYRSGRPDWHAIEALIDEWQPDEIVVGLPSSADGAETDFTRRVRRFASELGVRSGRRIVLVDEHLSTMEARARQRTKPMGARSRGPGTDAVAASVILEGWLHSAGDVP